MDTLTYILRKYDLLGKKLKSFPVEIPNVGRDDLARLFYELGFTEGVEIGVKEGDYSEMLCVSNPDLHLYSVDPWLVRDNYRDHRGQNVFDGYEKTAREKLSKYNCTIIKDLSENVVKQFANKSLDFVYVDGHHDFEHCFHDIHEWGKKIRPGGIIAGHDYVYYKKSANIHVHEVVDAYTKAYHIAPWFVLGLKEKIDGMVRDRHRSFFWVKE